ncbi:class I SAM-dependent methyltransferase [Amycolatopsis benzoatilytica]|uniref:class I SAM-dependent methyltransferase n=1 Tax=Amycolatopsis benzoatilytica TaxID=346045 RepID=UPI00037CF94D|nr:class I SAM-dependent methyltransferase [Amycolatopsis benzoatilytica]
MTAAENYLRDYHDRKPDAMSVLIESGRVTGDGRTSYQVLADRVAPARNVLDLGCGDGALLAVFARNGAEKLAGMDLSEGQLALARKRPELAGADLRHGRAQELPFADAAFEAVVSHMAFMLMDDPETVAAEVARVLVPRGTFAIVVGGPDSTGATRVFLELARPLFREVPEERRATYTKERRTSERSGIDEVLAPAGFAPVSWEPYEIDLTASPETVWTLCCESFYSTDTLDEDQRTRLRSAFLAETERLRTADGRLPAGLSVNLAKTRLLT